MSAWPFIQTEVYSIQTGGQNLSTIPNNPKTLTNQYSATYDAPRDPDYTALLHVIMRKQGPNIYYSYVISEFHLRVSSESPAFLGSSWTLSWCPWQDIIYKINFKTIWILHISFLPIKYLCIVTYVYIIDNQLWIGGINLFIIICSDLFHPQIWYSSKPGSKWIRLLYNSYEYNSY